jgi:hypothetical protein
LKWAGPVSELDRPLKKGEGVDRLRGIELPVYALSNRPMHGEGENGGRLPPTMHGASVGSTGSLRS